MGKKQKVLFVALGAFVVVVLGLAIFYFYEQNVELQAQYDLQKEQLEDQYEELTVQYEGMNKLNVRNDSLISQLDNEKVKVQRLLEELRQVKASDAKKISDLRNELSTLRSVMRIFVRQIDSLNQINAALTKENVKVKSDLARVNQQASEIEKERVKLEEKVTQAQLLEATNINCAVLDKRGRNTKKIKDITHFHITFAIVKNISAAVGERTLYAIITKPDGDVLMKSRADEFVYQNKKINYSCKKIISYDGELTHVELYWTVEEYLSDGNYRIDIFAEGNHIGRGSFSLK